MTYFYEIFFIWMFSHIFLRRKFNESIPATPQVQDVMRTQQHQCSTVSYTGVQPSDASLTGNQRMPLPHILLRFFGSRWRLHLTNPESFSPGLLEYLRKWAIPEKKTKKNWGDWGHNFLKKTLEFLGFLLHPWKFQITRSFSPENSQNCMTPVATLLEKFWGKKLKPLEIPSDFFLITSKNFTSFLINPWKFQMFKPLFLFGFFLE